MLLELLKTRKTLGSELLAHRFFGYERAKEFGMAGIGLLTYYIPINSKFIEPFIGIGGVYSFYHWELFSKKGNINDFNIAGGIGANFRVTDHFRIGINLLAVNSYETDYKYLNDRIEITGRKPIFSPILSFDYLF